MQVSILKVRNNQETNAHIIPAKTAQLPSLTDGWRFNFKSNTQKEKLMTYVLIADETPDLIEDCVSFKMKSKTEPYMAYIELAPHNRGLNQIYDRAAGCLIAFACRIHNYYCIFTRSW